MGAGHSVISIRSIPRDELTIQYFRETGIDLPLPPATAREPTPKDVRAAVEGLRGYQVTYKVVGDSLDIDIVRGGHTDNSEFERIKGPGRPSDRRAV